MKILNVAYPFAPVSDHTAGGAEHVLATLDRGLTAAGHQSFVVACEGSRVAGELLTTPLPTGLIDDAQRTATWSCYENAITKAIQRWCPDVVHLHGIDFPNYLPAPGVPVLATLHLPPSWYDPGVFHLTRPRTWLHCVSRSQQEACPPTPALLPYVANGVPENIFRVDIHPQRFALALGRVCPEKGFHLALAAARSADIPLLLAGQVYPYAEHQRYFESQVLPQCNRRARFLGPVGWRAKRRLLSSANCLLIPSLAPETSSLVAMETAMAGTPVVAFAAGALAHIVQPGLTGFLVDNVEQMAMAIGRCADIDRAQCRAYAREHFGAAQMISRYLALYERLR